MKRLGDICEIVSGTTPKTTEAVFWDGDIKWITPAELSENSFYVSDTVRHITDLGQKKSRLSLMPEGTVLLSSRAPIGKTAIVASPMCCNQGFKNLICGPEVFNEYLYFFLTAKTEYLNSLGRGATFKEISKKIVENIEIPLPSVEIQKHCAGVLRKVNGLIEKRRTQIATLNSLVKSQFVEMFPRGKWPSTSVEQALYIRDDLRKPLNEESRSKMKDGKLYPYYGANGQVDSINQYMIDDEALCLAEDCGAYGAGEDTSYIIKGKSWVNNHAHVLFATEKCNIVYANIYFKMLDFTSHVTGTTRLKLTQSSLKQIPVMLPPIEHQQLFEKVVNQVDKSKFTIQKSLDTLLVLKKSLMQTYFG